MTEDVLDKLLHVGLEEQLLDPEGIRRFSEALRDRAQLVLAERVAPLTDKLTALEKESGWLRSQQHALEKEIEKLRAEGAKASEAHERLLEHHRTLVGDVVAELTSLAGQLPWGYRAVRERLGELGQRLSKELG